MCSHFMTRAIGRATCKVKLETFFWSYKAPDSVNESYRSQLYVNLGRIHDAQP